VFGLMTFAMLLGSMNYNNNLSFILTFILIGIGFVAMHQCQRNLVGLELTFAGTDPVFAGQSIRFRVAITNQSKSARYGIRIKAHAMAFAFITTKQKVMYRTCNPAKVKFSYYP